MKKIIVTQLIFFLLTTIAFAQQPVDNLAVSVCETTSDTDTLPCKSSGVQVSTVVGINSKDKFMENIQSQRVAFITQKMELTPDEAQIFFPIYSQLTEKKRLLSKEKKQLTAKINTEALSKLSDNEADKMLEQLLDIERRQAELEREYAKKLKAAIPSKKLLLLHKSEAEFTRILLLDIKKGKKE